MSVRRFVLFDFLYLMYRRFIDDRCVTHATELSFASLLSVVPLMAVSLSVFAAFDQFEHVVKQIQDFFFTHFTPNNVSTDEIRKYILEFSKKATQLTGLGVAFLIVTALLLMHSIDTALNNIWQVKSKRGAIQGFLVYWAVLTIGPILMGVSVAITSYLVSLPMFDKTITESGLKQTLISLLPFLTSAFAFTLMYIVVPNRKVKILHGLVGGIVAALLFEAAKRGFAFYLTTFPTYKFIYGALAAIPIFIIWIYISWIVILLGAQTTHCLAIYKTVSLNSRKQVMNWIELLEILRQFSLPTKDGKAYSTEYLLNALPTIAESRLIEYLEKLDDKKVIQRSEKSEWVLVRDLNEYTLLDLYAAIPCSLPTTLPDLPQLQQKIYSPMVERSKASLEQALSGTLADLYRTE